MNTGHTMVETADSGPEKISAAGVSLASWYRREQTRLAAERRLAREQIAGGTSNREEMERVLAENVTEQKALDDGWTKSSLRAHISARAESSGPGGIERRVSVTSSAAGLAGACKRVTSATTQAVKLFGYASVFRKTADLGDFTEEIGSTAFDEVLRSPGLDVRGTINHDANFLFSRTTNGSLRLYADGIGLKFYSDLPGDGDTLTSAIILRVGQRLWTQCSFMFGSIIDKWILPRKEGDLDHRIIEKIGRLYDISIVSYPAYAETSVGLLVEKQRSADLPADDDDGGYAAYSEKFDAEYDEGKARGAWLRATESRLRQSQLTTIFKRLGRPMES